MGNVLTTVLAAAAMTAGACLAAPADATTARELARQWSAKAFQKLQTSEASSGRRHRMRVAHRGLGSMDLFDGRRTRLCRTSDTLAWTLKYRIRVGKNRPFTQYTNNVYLCSGYYRASLQDKAQILTHEAIHSEGHTPCECCASAAAVEARLLGGDKRPFANAYVEKCTARHNWTAIKFRPSP